MRRTPTDTPVRHDEPVIDLRDDQRDDPDRLSVRPDAVPPPGPPGDDLPADLSVTAVADRGMPTAGERVRLDRREFRRAGLTAIVVLAALNIADVVLTELLLARGAIELNPVAQPFLETHSMLALKLLVVAVLALDFVYRRPRVTSLCLLWLVTGFYLCVVIMNGANLVALG